MKRLLIQQAFYVPEDDVYYNSKNTHDFTGHKFRDGKEWYIDGGCSYARVVGNINEIQGQGRVVDFNLYTDDSGVALLTNEVADKILWGIVTPQRKFKYRPMKELNKHQLKEVALNEKYSLLHRSVATYWLKSRMDE